MHHANIGHDDARCRSNARGGREMILEEKDIEGYVRDAGIDELARLVVNSLGAWHEVRAFIDALCALLPDEETP
jgi:hypothetical protein